MFAGEGSFTDTVAALNPDDLERMIRDAQRAAAELGNLTTCLCCDAQCKLIICISCRTAATLQLYFDFIPQYHTCSADSHTAAVRTCCTPIAGLVAKMTDVVLNARLSKWTRKLLRYITDFDLPEQLRKKYTVSVPNSKYNAKWQKLMLSRTSPAADGTAAICNYCRRRLKRRIMPDHAIADGMWMGEASSIPEYADLSEMEVMLLAVSSKRWQNARGNQGHLS